MLRRVEIASFRSCENLVLTDLEGVLALVGRNGAGKTNILRAIEWASKTAVSTQPSSADMIQLISRAPLPAVTLYFETSNELFEYSVAQVPMAQEGGRAQFSVGLVEQLKKGPSPEGEVIFSRLREKVTLHQRGQEFSIGASTPAIRTLLAIFPEDDPLHPLLKVVASYFEGVRYYPLDELDTSSRFVQGAHYQAWAEALNMSSQVSDDSTVMRLIKLKLDRLDDFHEIEELVGPDGLNIISKITVGDIRLPSLANNDASSAGDVELEVEVNSSAPPDFYLVDFLPSGFDEKKKNPVLFGFNDLSYGTKRLLTIVTSIIFDRSNVLLVEQPEDGIHIGLLNKLTPMVRAYSDSMQFILASHSRDVLDRFKPSELRLVSLNAGKSSVRALTDEEALMAERFIEEEGPLTDFIETLGDD